MRTATVFDGTEANGRPILNRPPLHPQEIPWLLHYLDQAPVVLTGTGYDADVYDPRSQDLPQTYSTDGTWIWHAAVTYYLRKYGIAPEPALVDHIRTLRYQPPALSDADRGAAEAEIRQQLGLGTPSPTPAAPPAPPAPATEEAPTAEREALDRARAAAGELRIDPGRFAVGARVEHALSLAREGGRWLVVSPEGAGHDFADAASAATFFVGHLYLHRQEMGSAEAAPAAAPARPEERAPEPATPAPEPAEWPFQPLPGEPPLSLFRRRSVEELPPGTEIDRLGDPAGNVTYAAGTPWAQRSLPPDWQQRPYHAYRVERALQTIRGTAIPWFNQPGGGTGYVLPRAVADLFADGTLTEIPGSRPA